MLPLWTRGIPQNLPRSLTTKTKGKKKTVNSQASTLRITLLMLHRLAAAQPLTPPGRPALLTRFKATRTLWNEYNRTGSQFIYCHSGPQKVSVAIEIQDWSKTSFDKAFRYTASHTVQSDVWPTTQSNPMRAGGDLRTMEGKNQHLMGSVIIRLSDISKINIRQMH